MHAIKLAHKVVLLTPGHTSLASDQSSQLLCAECPKLLLSSLVALASGAVGMCDSLADAAVAILCEIAATQPLSLVECTAFKVLFDCAQKRPATTALVSYCLHRRHGHLWSIQICCAVSVSMNVPPVRAHIIHSG